MTTDDLRRALNAVGAVNRGGDFYCACLVCQPDETATSEFRCHLKPGRLYPIVAFCFRCCHPGDSVGVRDWWAQFLAATRGAIPRPCTRRTPIDEIQRCWTEIDARADCGAPVAPVDVLNAVYTTFLEHLELNERHRKWLQRRGLDADWAFAAGYRTSPMDFLNKPRSAKSRRVSVAGDDGDVRELLDRLYATHGFALAAVPGFSIGENSEIRLRCRAPAVLTPCRDFYGRIFALKHRMLDGGQVRMRLLSSKAVGGPQAIVDAHYPLGVGRRRWPRLWVTEGERKADVHWTRRELPTVAIPGTGTWQAARRAVAISVESGGEVVVALDQDDAGRRAGEALTQALADDGYRVFAASWEGRKGLDDAVLSETPINCTEVRKVDNKRSIPSARVSDQRSKPTRLRDDEILPYVREFGPVLANDLPAYPYTITRLVRDGHLRVTFTPKGQLLRAAP